MSGDAGRVLLVEDDADLRDALALVLRARGWEVTAVGSADEALSVAGDGPVDAAVADLGLPDSSGASLVEVLRDALPDARLVVFTGREDPEVRRACRVAGADDYVVKPVSGGELAELLGG